MTILSLFGFVAVFFVRFDIAGSDVQIISPRPFLKKIKAASPQTRRFYFLGKITKEYERKSQIMTSREIHASHRKRLQKGKSREFWRSRLFCCASRQKFIANSAQALLDLNCAESPRFDAIAFDTNLK